MLVRLDGRRDRWFGPARPFATLLAATDDANGEVVGALFGEQEDAAGYVEVLQQMLARGVPLAVYRDRHGIFRRDARERASLEEELAGEREPTQLGRAFGELGRDDLRLLAPGQRPRGAPVRHARGPPGRRAGLEGA